MTDYSKLKNQAEIDERCNERFTNICPSDLLELIAENEALKKDAERYQVLRQADVDTIHNGGLFAGLTPDNIVINGNDLDERTDAVIAARKEGF